MVINGMLHQCPLVLCIIITESNRSLAQDALNHKVLSLGGVIEHNRGQTSFEIQPVNKMT